eukprot:SAG31_NODE_7711_length_1611_cov_1.617063_1_plen_21_part_10
MALEGMLGLGDRVSMGTENSR